MGAITIEKAREIFDYVYRESVATVNAAKSHDEAKNQCLLFLIRAINAAGAARTLFERGYELEAKGVTRVIIEAFLEFSFITCDPAKRAARMKLFHDHAAFGRYKEARSIAKLHGTTDTNPHLRTLEAAWAAIEANYDKNKPWNWCTEFNNLRKRATEAARVLDANHPPAPGAPTQASVFEWHYDLAYAEGCMAAHMSPESFYELPDSLIGPSPSKDGGTLEWIAVMLAILADSVAEAVGHHPECIFNRAVEMVKQMSESAGL